MHCRVRWPQCPYYFFFDEDFLRGTLPPAFRACDKPIAIACLRLFTFLPDRPLLSLPRFRSCIAFSTFSDAFFSYLAIAAFLLVEQCTIEAKRCFNHVFDGAQDRARNYQDFENRSKAGLARANGEPDLRRLFVCGCARGRIWDLWKCP